MVGVFHALISKKKFYNTHLQLQNAQFKLGVFGFSKFLFRLFFIFLAFFIRDIHLITV
jgi:hypothetical protein